jgi:O-antigen/teichoic acid export membrane protein
MAAVLMPSIASALAARDGASARAYLAGAMRFMTVVLVPACVLIAVNAREVLALLFSSEYAAGAELLAILIFGHGLLHTVFMSLAYILIGAGHAWGSARLALAALSFAVVLSVTLVLLAGASGAAIAALLANAAAVIGACLMIGRAIAWPLEAAIWPRVLLLTAVLAAIAWWVEAHGVMLLVELALLGVAYVALLPAFGMLSRADLEPFMPSSTRRAG